MREVSRVRIFGVRLSRAKRIKTHALRIVEVLTVAVFATVGGVGRVW